MKCRRVPASRRSSTCAGTTPGSARECFLHHCREQVRRAIDDFDMIAAGRARAGRGVGRQGLARRCGSSSRELGYEADGLYLGLGIGEYSDESGEYAARVRGASSAGRCIEVDLRRRRTASTSPTRRARRQARAVLGVRAVEAPPVQRRRARRTATTSSPPATTSTTKPRCCSATCCAGTTELPRPPAPGAPGRAGLRAQGEAARAAGRTRDSPRTACCTGIDYIVEECPMAAGNRHLGYKEVLNDVEDRSPGTKAAFLFGVPRARPRPLRAPTPSDERDDLRPCSVCGAPTPGDVCAFCRLRARARSASRSAAERRARERRRSRRATACCSSTTSAAATSITLAGGRAVPHARRRRRARRPHRPARRHDRAHDAERAPRRGAPDARRVRARDAARRAGDLPEGPRPDPDARRRLPRRAGARVGRRVGRARRSRCCARSARPGTSPATRSATTSPQRAVANVARLPRRRRAARRRGARRLRRHRRSTTSTASCSTSPSRGGS